MSVNIYNSSTKTLTKVPGTETNKYSVDDAAETALADADYVPFYDSSASARRKSTWANIVAKIKSAIGIASSGSTYLKKDGTWGTPTNTVPTAYCDTAAATAAKVATCSGYSLLSKSYLHVVIVNTNTAASAITLNVNSKGAKPIYINGSASSASNYTLTAGTYLVYYNGTNYYFRTDGLITGPGIVDIGGNTSKFLRGDGTWQTPTNTTYSVVSTSANGLAPKVTDTAKFLKGDGTWATPTNTWTALTGATSSANGTVGYINAAPPKDGYNTKYFRADGTWQVPPNTTYSVVSTSANGLAPKVTDTTKFLKGDGTWATPTNTTYSVVSSSANGLAPKVTDTTKYLRGDGTWQTPTNTDIRPSAYCDTAAATAAKVASCTGYSLASKSYIHVVIVNANSAASAITLNINGKGAKPIYINGTASSASNYTLPAGSYLVYYNGTNYYFRTDGLVTSPGIVDIGGNTTKFLRGDGTWQTPTNTTYSVVSTSANGLAPKVTDTTKYLRGDGTWATPTNTTYSSKAAASGGTDVSLCTTGEKYTWNNKSTVPTSHASTATTYGIGNASNYGHVKLSDTYTSNVGAAANAIGASQTALYNAYTALNGKTSFNVSGITTASTNMNSYTTNGVYYFSSDYTPTNVPSGVSNGWFVVMKSSGGAVKQILYRAGTAGTTDYDTYVRSYVGNTWSSWAKYETVTTQSGSATLNTTNTTTASPGVSYYRYGHIVYVSVQVVMASTASSTYATYVIASGLPKGIRDNAWIGNVSVDGWNNGPHFGVSTAGNLYVMARVNSIAGQMVVGGFTYICA